MTSAPSHRSDPAPRSLPDPTSYGLPGRTRGVGPYVVAPGSPHVLGVTVEPDGTNVAVWGPRLRSLTLSLWDDGLTTTETRVPFVERTDGVWHLKVRGLRHGQPYALRADGPDADPDDLLLDPYARAVVGGLDGHRSRLRGVVLDDPFDWAGDAAPRVPADRRVVYETHVRGLTMQHPDVPEELRGTYAALAHPAVVAHLRDLGVTTLELLPVHQVATEPAVAARGKVNYWGYSTAAFLAPDARYAAAARVPGADPALAAAEAVTELRTAVRGLHAAGIEVVLDVVYNHTCEGGPDGPLVSLRGLDDEAYYRHRDGGYLDVTGCGNTLRTDHPAAERLVLDSLRHWVTSMHVDGFRFDLASALARTPDHRFDPHQGLVAAIAADPVLRTVALVAEPWDATPEGYRVGGFGREWAEWNDRFRDGVRDFWRAAPGGVRDLARRLSGSADLFAASGRGVLASVNFVTAHDGFTLRDTVSYDRKHNLANGEDDRDGHDDNRSWGCGADGPTEDAGVLALRSRQAANLLTTLLLAQGVPMLGGGDEWGRTQEGNNNAYCQDSPLTWQPWSADAGWEHLAPLVRRLTALRAAHPAFRASAHRHGEPVAGGAKDLAWLHPHGREMSSADWFDTGLNSVGMYLSGDADHDALTVLFHAGPEPVRWTLPGEPWAASWSTVLGTAGVEDDVRLAPGTVLDLPDRSVQVLLGARAG